MAKVTYVWERRTLGFINNYMAKITYVWEGNRSLINNYMANITMSERGEP